MAAVASEKMVDPTPSSIPPISQSMDSNNSPRRFSCDTPPSGAPETEPLDRSSPSTPSPSRQLEPQLSGQSLSKVEEYRQLFRLPPDEVLVQDFNCAFQENFLIQGHMYLFVHNICFYSNLFGFETKKIIPFHEITSVRRANVVGVFPTAIEILAGGKKYFFTSFLSRDEAYKIINDGWLQHSNGPNEITDHQEPKYDISSQENGKAIVEESSGSRLSTDESQIIERVENAPTSEDGKLFGDGGPNIVSTSLNVQVREEENAEAARNSECSSSAKSSAWEPEDADAPGVPECYIKVAESKFPIQVHEFFNMFFSDDGISFQKLFHGKCGDKDFKSTPWRPHETFGHIRDVSFQHPIKIYFGARFGSCQETQKYRVYRNCHLIVDTSQEISDVPYGDYFCVEGRWDVEETTGSAPGCILRVYTNVAFSKKTMWKGSNIWGRFMNKLVECWLGANFAGKIVQSTVEECREAYATWIDLAHEVLKQKNLEKEEGVCASNLISSEQVQLEKQANTQNYVEMEPSDARISQTIPDMNQVADPLQGNFSKISVGSFIGDILASLKHQKKASLLLVITVAIVLILMQISILVLLSRPQRIQVIPQANFMHGTGESRAEALASVNKQIRYLKEEMHFMETLLDKMQNEHALLKEKLKDLELFRNLRI